MKKNEIIIFFLSIIFPITIFAQDYKTQKDTLYLIYLETTLSNGRPVTSCVLLQDLNMLDTLSDIDSFSNYVCSLYDVGVYTIDLYLGFQLMMSYFSTEDFLLMDKKITSSIRRLNNSYCKIGKKYFRDHNTLYIEVTKLYCDYWILDEENKPSISEAIRIPENCQKEEYFIIKQIFNIFKLTKKELDNLKTKLVNCEEDW